MKKPPRVEISVNRVVPVLSITPIEEDHAALNAILNGSETNWEILQADSFASALRLQRRRWSPIVICEQDLPGSSWKIVLEQFSFGEARPLLIVTSRLADERLWAEALNLGAHDVLAKPFNSQEVYRTVDSAWRHWAASRVQAPQPLAMPAASEGHKSAVAAALRSFAAS